MELTKEELILLLQMLQQITLPDALTKITAGQLQQKVEANLSASAPSQVERQQTPSQTESPEKKDKE